jgi:hypothetical protein
MGWIGSIGSMGWGVCGGWDGWDGEMDGIGGTAVIIQKNTIR